MSKTYIDSIPMESYGFKIEPQGVQIPEPKIADIKWQHMADAMSAATFSMFMNGTGAGPTLKGVYDQPETIDADYEDVTHKRLSDGTRAEEM